MNKYFKMAMLLLFILGFSFLVSCNKDKPGNDDDNPPQKKRNIYWFMIQPLVLFLMEKHI